MKVALVADLHGNLPAVEALDADLKRRGITEIWCLGDMVGKGPSSAETLDWALDRCSVILRGNWDEGIGMCQFERDEFYYRQLGRERMRKLCEFPLEHHTVMSGKKVRLFHGRPVVDYPLQVYDDADVLETYFGQDFQVVGYADIHRQGLRVLRTRGILFNTGSIGNSMGVTMVQYMIAEFGATAADTLDLNMVSLEYDRERAVRDAVIAGEKGLVNADLYIREIRTGIYSR